MTLTLDDGLCLAAPGGAFDPRTGTLVVADVHAGYVRALQSSGHVLPGVDDRELLARLAALRAMFTPKRVIVAGDVVHGPAALRASAGAPSALAVLLRAFEGCDALVVGGNHDRGLRAALRGSLVTFAERASFGLHVVVHGDDVDLLRGERALALRRGGRVVVGHHHPALTLHGADGARAKVMAFAWGPGFLCLPALTPFARGADLLRDADGEGLSAAVPAAELETAVIVGAQVVRTGRLDRLRALHPRARRRTIAS